MTDRSQPPADAKLFHHRWRFGVVLLGSLLLAVGQPLMAGLVDERGSFGVFFSLLIAAVLLLVFDDKKHRRIAFSLSLAAFFGIWAGYAIGGPAGRLLVVGAYLLGAGFFAFALFGILRATLAKHVSGDAIFGAVCGYLLLGTIWSLLYHAVETAAPGSFRTPSSGAEVAVRSVADSGTLSYFSFVTLATVGYGDVTPATPLAQMLAWTEAVTGQLYLAILVAGIVGFKVTQATNNFTNRGIG